MRYEVTVGTAGGREADVVIEAALNTTGAQLQAALGPSWHAVYADGVAVLPERTLGESRLSNGQRLTGSPTAPPIPWPCAGLSLAVLSGQGAGLVRPLAAGDLTLGRASTCDVVVSDPLVSSSHARLCIAPDGTATLTDLNSSNGTRIAGAYLKSGVPTPLRVGEQFMLGWTVCVLLPPSQPDASIEWDAELGERRFNRLTRFLAPFTPDKVTIPARLEPPTKTSSWLTYASSGGMMLVGVVSAVVLKNWLFAIGGIGLPLIMIVSSVLMARNSRAADLHRAERAADIRRKALQQATQAAARERDYLWTRTFDPASAHLAAIGPTKHLWSTDAVESHALTVRLGLWDRPASVLLTGADADEQPILSAVPVELNLRSAGVLGIAGAREVATRTAIAIVHQLAVARSPQDLTLFYLSSGVPGTEWRWLRWLPHLRALNPDVHQAAPGGNHIKDRLNELIRIIEARKADERLSRGVGDTIVTPEIVVVLDGAGALRGRSSVPKLLADGPSVGVYAIALDETESRLPLECGARFNVAAHDATLNLRASEAVTEVIPDQLDARIAERSARRLAPLVPLGGGVDTVLPAAVRYVDLLGLHQPTAAQLAARWGESREGRAEVGLDEHGNPVTLDLVADGPHALVAGTSGSGKSEFLRTWLVGMALSASPEDLTLFLIDFKGGGAFGRLTALPHVVGYADDLTIGGVLANRLLDSLNAELRRRKAIFKAAGKVGDLEQYRAARSRSAGMLEPVPRLVIVVDEFAELKAEQPDFVDGLVSVARTGRSLGVHLILATQQPAGVVSAQILDNTNLRVCLRVLDRSTSQDIVGTPAAATFPHQIKGRAVMSLGEGGGGTIFQAGYVSGSPRRTLDASAPAPTVAALPWESCGRGVQEERRAESPGPAETDLTQLVDALQQAWTLVRTRLLPRPWLPPLGRVLTLERIAGASKGPRVAFAVEDLPAEQRQTAVHFHLGRGNLGIAGGHASGRTTALRTLACAVARHVHPDQVHLYVIDYSSAPALRPLADLPHCGAVVTRSERYLCERLVSRLLESLAERSRLLHACGAADFSDLVRRTGADAPPRIVLLVDGWDTIFADAENGSPLRDDLVALAADGPALGVQLAVAGGARLDYPRLVTHLSDLLCLRFDQRDDLGRFDVPHQKIPAELPPGRAYRGHRTNAIQIAVVSAATGPADQNRAIAELARTLPAPVRHQPLRFRPLPARAVLPSPADAGERGTVLLGLGGDDASPRRVAVAGPAPFVIIGRPGSGRTHALALLCRQLSAQGVPVALRNVAEESLPLFGGAAPLAPGDEVPDGGVLVVDDAETIPPDDSQLLGLATRRPTGLILAVDQDVLGGYVPSWKTRFSDARGLVLCPRSRDAAGPLGFKCEPFSGPPGRGLLLAGDEPELVQVFSAPSS